MPAGTSGTEADAVVEARPPAHPTCGPHHGARHEVAEIGERGPQLGVSRMPSTPPALAAPRLPVLGQGKGALLGDLGDLQREAELERLRVVGARDGGHVAQPGGEAVGARRRGRTQRREDEAVTDEGGEAYLTGVAADREHLDVAVDALADLSRARELHRRPARRARLHLESRHGECDPGAAEQPTVEPGQGGRQLEGVVAVATAVEPQPPVWVRDVGQRGGIGAGGQVAHGRDAAQSGPPATNRRGARGESDIVSRPPARRRAWSPTTGGR